MAGTFLTPRPLEHEGVPLRTLLHLAFSSSGDVGHCPENTWSQVIGLMMVWHQAVFGILCESAALQMRQSGLPLFSHLEREAWRSCLRFLLDVRAATGVGFSHDSTGTCTLKAVFSI